MSRIQHVCFMVSFFLWVSSTQAKDQRNIRTEPGQNVTLPCRAPDTNKPIKALEWTRTDLESECVLFYRDGHFDSHCQHPSFKNRVDLQDRQMKDGDVSLVLKNVLADDGGTYECRVYIQTRGGTKRAVLSSDPISTINLDVAPSPSPHPPGVGDGNKEDGGNESQGNLWLILVLSGAAIIIVVMAVILWKQRNCLCSRGEPGQL
ncbi:hypothetical protein AMECASPLE_017860 [Ameca splendens]|uniref:Ig-like domain-containing protein n=1 Tax=Ameca splendens TaxID=208324 RepID=A0ABV0Z1Q7_9TELE